MLDVIDQHVSDVGRDDDFERLVGGHHAWHAIRKAGEGGRCALPAFGLVGEIGFEPRLIFGREGGLLAAAEGLRGIVRRLADRAGDPRAHPQPLPVRIGRIIEGARTADGGHQRRGGQRRDKGPGPRRPAFQLCSNL
jgi:hypothetical protein